MRIKERIGRHTSELRRTVGFLCEVRQHLRRFAAGWHDAVVHGQVEQPGASAPDLKASVPESRFLEIAADPKDAAPFEAAFGKGGAAVLVRPDGYADLTTAISAAADHVAAYHRKWFCGAADARS